MNKKESYIGYLQSVPEEFFDAYAISSQGNSFQMKYNSGLIEKYWDKITSKEIMRVGYVELVFTFDDVTVKVTMT